MPNAAQAGRGERQSPTRLLVNGGERNLKALTHSNPVNQFAIGQFCPALAELFTELCRSTALCITAYNPLGRELGDGENEVASEKLRNALAELNLPFFPALGKGPDGSWGPEPGYMVFGMTCVQAKRLGSFSAKMRSFGLAQALVPEVDVLVHTVQLGGYLIVRPGRARTSAIRNSLWPCSGYDRCCTYSGTFMADLAKCRSRARSM